MSFLFDKAHQTVHQLGNVIKSKISTGEVHSHTHDGDECHPGAHDAHLDNRYLSFAVEHEGNDAKWYVDACGYMWAVSKALEQAKESIWILDCKHRHKMCEERVIDLFNRVAVARIVSSQTSCQE
jgi:phospholipase D1/2